jgi:hypothetical protein
MATAMAADYNGNNGDGTTGNGLTGYDNKNDGNG